MPSLRFPAETSQVSPYAKVLRQKLLVGARRDADCSKNLRKVSVGTGARVVVLEDHRATVEGKYSSLLQSLLQLGRDPRLPLAHRRGEVSCAAVKRAAEQREGRLWAKEGGADPLEKQTGRASDAPRACPS